MIRPNPELLNRRSWAIVLRFLMPVDFNIVIRVLRLDGDDYERQIMRHDCFYRRYRCLARWPQAVAHLRLPGESAEGTSP